MMSTLRDLQAMLLRHETESWDSTRTEKRPIARIVDAIVEKAGASDRVLALLLVSVAKRVLPCWQLYCDGEEPLLAVARAEDAVYRGAPPPEACFETAPAPSLSGKSIVDCRASDTRSAADAVARCVRFLRHGDVEDAIACLQSADDASQESPLGGREEFRRWLREVALPAAWAERPLTVAEETSFREYTTEEVLFERQKQGGKLGPLRSRLPPPGWRAAQRSRPAPPPRPTV